MKAYLYKTKIFFLYINNKLQIEDIAILRHLKKLTLLENLNLSGNPICKIPNYKNKMLASIPNLK